MSPANPSPQKLPPPFFAQDAVSVAQNLLGKTIVRRWDDGTENRFCITETEAYLGEQDKACHAHKGRTPRTEIMYAQGGHVYVYLIYGIHWLLNFVTGTAGDPQAVLIRGVDTVKGSGRVGKLLGIDRSFYGENLFESQRLWVEDAPHVATFTAAPRIGVDYAGDEWKNKPWRFIMSSSL